MNLAILVTIALVSVLEILSNIFVIAMVIVRIRSRGKGKPH